jgi:hypothetical protein
MHNAQYGVIQTGDKRCLVLIVRCQLLQERKVRNRVTVRTSRLCLVARCFDLELLFKLGLPKRSPGALSGKKYWHHNGRKMDGYQSFRNNCNVFPTSSFSLANCVFQWMEPEVASMSCSLAPSVGQTAYVTNFGAAQTKLTARASAGWLLQCCQWSPAPGPDPPHRSRRGTITDVQSVLAFSPTRSSPRERNLATSHCLSPLSPFSSMCMPPPPQ